MNHLPTEILAHIFSYFSQKELCWTIAPICTRWRNVSKLSHFWNEVNILEKKRRTPPSVYQRFANQFTGLHTLRLYCNYPSFLTKNTSVVFPSLKILELHMKIYDVNFHQKHINQIHVVFPVLEEIYVEMNELILHPECVQSITSCPKLRSITLQYFDSEWMSDDQCLEMLATQCSSLQRVNIRCGDNLSDESVEKLCALHQKTLTYLSLRSLRLTNRAVQAALTCKKLRGLEIIITDKMNATALQWIAQMTHLKILNLDLEAMLDFPYDDLMENICVSLKKLIYLKMDDMLITKNFISYSNHIKTVILVDCEIDETCFPLPCHILNIMNSFCRNQYKNLTWFDVPYKNYIIYYNKLKGIPPVYFEKMIP